MYCQDQYSYTPFLDRPVAALAVCLAAKAVVHTRGLVDAVDVHRTERHAAARDETPGGCGDLNDLTTGENDSGVTQQRQHGADELWRTDRDAAANALVTRCSEAEATLPIAWRPFLDAYAATLPTRGPLLDDTGASGESVYSTGTALAVIQRILPVLDAHRLVVYGMRLQPEYTDHVAGPWDRVVPRPMVEIDCGTGVWLLQVAAGRVWSDDVREGQETAGGALAVRFAVNRSTGAFVDAGDAWLGDGRNAATDALFAFFRSGASQIDAYVDARYGRIYRAPTALTASSGWRPANDKGDGYLCRSWSIVSADCERATEFVRASDGRRVRVTSQHGSVFVSAGNDRVSLPDAAYPTPPTRDGVDYPFAVQRPPADYAKGKSDDDDSDDDDDKYHRHNCGDRGYLVAQGLLDPMHMVSEWMGRNAYPGITTLSPWPYIRFDFDPDQHMDALDEADWHARLSARMHLVADLSRGDYGPPVDSDALAVASASTLLARAPVFVFDPQGVMRPANGRTCDAVFGHLTSLGAARPWRIFRQKQNLCYGNRYHDPTRGLCVNWFVECNFAQSMSDDARPTVRFYGHIVGLDAASLDDVNTEPASDSFTMVAAYYCLSARARMPGRYDDGVWDLDGADTDDVAIASAIDAAFDAAQPSPTTRFAADEPHPLVAYYREREFDLAPGHFRGILDEDAMRVNVDSGGRSTATLVSALDWLATAFDRHATLFALRSDL